MAQKVLSAYVGQSSGSLSYLTKEPTLGPLFPEIWGGRNISRYFLTFRPTKLKVVILEIETFLTSQNLA